MYENYNIFTLGIHSLKGFPNIIYRYREKVENLEVAYHINYRNKSYEDIGRYAYVSCE